MSFTNKYLIYFYLFLLSFNISCTSPRVSVLALDFSPIFSKKVFKSNINKKEKRAEKNYGNSTIQFEASKELTIFLYGFIMDEAIKAKNEDYSLSRSIYSAAHIDFIRSIEYINRSLVLDYPNYNRWLNEKKSINIKFKKESAEKLYWAAAAYAGAIQSSNGSPEWVVQLPKIGKLLETGMLLDPEWNFGSFYTAMISYTLIRHDARDNKMDIAKSFFQKAVIASKGQDLSPYISYAQNIAITEQDKNEFTNMLYKALNIDIYANPEVTLSNYINRKKANWLLDNIEEYFY
ncbi:MAG: TRAP transporter TatT component family protein [Candidatus Neomarinimicrobiota bacterium]|nr:MAG: hypothetical protein CBC68_02385 [Candidatus Marinimicrobia bacterium TMED108]RCL89560.1 MAG: hypothetical protein DBW60_03530 [bacterium]|tara:strand:- start:701 stop:1573 length:873 start_codon:yes stop_codon:yes gene_type:complete